MTITATVDLNEDSHQLTYFKTKKPFHIFHLYFFKSNPFDSTALGRLIERVADPGFMKTKKPKYHFESNQ